MDSSKILESIKEISGIVEFQHYVVREANFETWVSEPDSIGAFIIIDKSGNIAVYGKTAEGIDKIYLNVYDLDDFKLDYAAVRMMIMIENHPEHVSDKKIDSAVTLLQWTQENDTLLHLDLDEAEAVMSVYSETGYELYYDDTGNIYMYMNGKAIKACMDDVIDLAGERSYEDICQIKEALEQIPIDKAGCTVEKFSNQLNMFTELLNLEMRNKSIISAYSKTVYGKRYYYNYQYTKKTIPTHGMKRPRKI